MDATLCSPYTLGHYVIDTLHQEMTALVEASRNAPDMGLANVLISLQHHTEHHFAQEESLMRDHHYRGYSEHRHEHQKLLAELQDMLKAATRGRHRLARAWLNERLPEWFRLHVANLDGSLVSFLKQRVEREGDSL